MFSVTERAATRDHIIDMARSDTRITGGAITGSYALDAEDEWSDIDTAFGYDANADPEAILRDWTADLGRQLGIVHYFDLRRGETLYRVFLLSNALEIDVSLTPAATFGAHGPSFRLLFGKSVDAVPTASESRDELIGWGWIYVLSARAAIARGRLWQAVRLIGAVRDNGLALACVRQGVPSAYAKGVHKLGDDATEPWQESLVRSVDADELHRALGVATDAFLREVAQSDPILADRLAGPLRPEALG
jgi:hypothetical protein